MQLRRRSVRSLIPAAAALAASLAAPARAALEPNVPPECDAGGPYVIECAGATTQFILDGSGSFDPDTGPGPLTFLWATDCPGAVIDDPAAPITTMTVDTAAPCPLDCLVTLTVGDGADDAQCDATVTIEDTEPPALICPPDVTVSCDGPVDPASTGSPAGVVTSVFFTDIDLPRIRRAPAGGGAPVNVLGAGLGDPFFVAVDPAGGRFYWTDAGTTSIQRADLDGSNVQPLVTTGLGAPRGIALDVADDRMYWADAGTGKIQRADLDGGNVQDLVTGLTSPSGVALDLVNGRIYWVDPSADRIQRADLDGGNVQDVLTAGLITPYDITLDSVGGRIYWTDIGGPAAIRRADLDGGNVEDLVTTDLLTPQGIAVDVTARKIYWADPAAGRVKRADLDGGNVEEISTSPAPSGVDLLRESTVSDACGDVTLTFSDVEVPGLCPEEAVITRTWTAADACGNAVSCDQVITIVDETPPVITGVPGDETVECDSVPDPPAVVATDNCSSPILEFDETLTGSCPSTLVRNWVATDACGNTATATQRITVQDTMPPVITCPPDLVLECPADTHPDSTGHATASDPCGDATIGFTDAVTPGCGMTAVIVRTWTAVDACGNGASCEQLIEVVDTMPPAITCPADVTIECGDDTSPASTGTPVANDACSTVTLEFSDTLVPDCGNSGVIVRTWTATDACGNAAPCEQRITVTDTVPPSITCPADVVLECPASTDPSNTGTPTVDDACGDVTVAFTDEFTPACGITGTTVRTWTVTDGCGNTDSCQQVITLVDTTPPDVQCPPQIGVQCESEVPDPMLGDVTGTDACGDVTIEFVGDVPTGSCPTFITRTYRGIDECGNVTECAQIIGVFDDIPPIITCPFSFPGQCEEDIPPAAQTLPEFLAQGGTVSDNCGIVDFEHVGDILPPDLCGPYNTILRTYRVTDVCFNTNQCVQFITVQDTTPPVITCPDDVTLECPADSSPGSTGTATATDNCDAGATVSFSDAVTPGCGGTATIVRTWTAVDACNNQSNCQQTITIVDTTPPVITCPPPLIFECDADIPAPDPDSIVCSDTCSPDVTVEHVSDAPSGDDCPRLITRTYRCTDACGNSVECGQLITVDDMTPPVIACPPDAVIECDCDPDPVDAMAALYSVDRDSDRLRTIDPATGATLTSVVIVLPGRTVLGGTGLAARPGTGELWALLKVSGQGGRELVTVDPGTGLATSVGNTDAAGERFAELAFNDDGSTLYGVTGDGSVANPESLHTLSQFDGSPSLVCALGRGDAGEAIGFHPGGGALHHMSGAGDQIFETIDDVGVDPCTTTDIPMTGSGFEESASLTFWTADGVFLFGDIEGDFFSLTTSGAITYVATLDHVASGLAWVGGQSCATGMAGATDNCDDEPVITFVDDETPGVCPSVRVITRTWTATDSCGNESTCVQTIDLVDATPPVITCPPDVGLECSDSTDPADTGEATATDSCAGGTPVTITFADDLTPGSTLWGFTIIRTWTATDSCGNEDSCEQVITGTDTVAPALLGVPGDTTAECDNIPAPDPVTSVDNCDPLPEVTFAETISGACTGTLTRSWTSTDKAGNVSTLSQVITLGDTTPPEITCPPDVVLECPADTDPGSTGTATAVDNCGAVTITFADAVTPGCGATVTIVRTWTATDECDNSASCDQVIEVIDTTPPSITCPPSVTLECPAGTDPSSTGAATGSDACGAVSITFFDGMTSGCGFTRMIVRTWTATDECGNSASCEQVIEIVDTTPPAITCPPDVALECPAGTDPSSTGAATGSDACGAVSITFFDGMTPGCGATVTIVRTWTATDECGNSASCDQVIEVIDTAPPAITCPPDVTLECPADTGPGSTGAATATDNCGDVTIVFADVVTGGCGQASSIVRTWTATDACGNAASCTQVIEVVDTTPPTIACPRDVVLECPASTLPDNTGVPRAGDMCGDVTISFTDATTPGCGVTSSIARTWTATDACGNTATCVQMIEIVDTTPPVVACPPDVSTECPAGPGGTGTATATDACGDVAVAFTDLTMPGCGATATIMRTWTATDACGNTATCAQHIEIVDTTPPVIACPPDVTLECPADTDPGSTGFATATDTCGATTVTFVDAVEDSCSGTGTIVRTWTATDACGNTSGCVQVIDVIDVTPPMIICAPDVTLECPASTDPGSTGTPEAIDACGDVTLTFEDMNTPGCGETGSILRAWTATDDCGNTSGCNQVITVVDTLPPTITCPADVTLECPADTSPGSAGVATATDPGGCDPAPVVDFTDETLPGECPGEMTIIRTWSAVDDCGNTSSCAQTITVRDQTPPVVTCPADAVIECEVPYTFVTEAADSCGGAVTVECSAIFIPSDAGTLADNGDGSFTIEFASPTTTIKPMAVVTCMGLDACSNAGEPCHFVVVGDCPGACIPVCSVVILEPPATAVSAGESTLLQVSYALVEPVAPDCEVEAVIDIGCQTVPVMDGQIVDLLCAPDPIPCRLTGGGNSGHEAGANRFTFGGQVGAPTANQPQPCGEWTHRQHSGPDGKFTFRAGTASAPAGTVIDDLACTDPGTCTPSGNPLSPARQLDFEGIGSFKNIQNPSPPLAGVVPDETLHWFQVHAEDLGEPGNQGDPDGPNCPHTGSAGGFADCDCPDFYAITIHETAAPSSPVIYEAYTYLNGGNFQVHPPTNGGGNCGAQQPLEWPGGPTGHPVDDVTSRDGGPLTAEAGFDGVNGICAAELVDGVLVINSEIAILIVTATDGTGNVEECVIDICDLIAGGAGEAMTAGGGDVPAVGVRHVPSDVELGGVRTSPAASADLDGDGDVDDADAFAVVSTLGSAGGPGDLDGDGIVSASDLLIVLDQFAPGAP